MRGFAIQYLAIKFERFFAFRIVPLGIFIATVRLSSCLAGVGTIYVKGFEGEPIYVNGVFAGVAGRGTVFVSSEGFNLPGGKVIGGWDPESKEIVVEIGGDIAGKRRKTAKFDGQKEGSTGKAWVWPDGDTAPGDLDRENASPASSTLNSDFQNKASAIRSPNAEQMNPSMSAAMSFKTRAGFDKSYNKEGNKETGLPEDVYFKGKLLQNAFEKDPNGTYCSGFTFATVMKAAESRGLLESKENADIKRFRNLWYGVAESSGPAQRSDALERQAVFALENLGIGKSIDKLEDLRPGDFLMFWRSSEGYGNGHSAVFVSWIKEKGRIIGVHYRSSQSATNGIDDNSEYFTDVVKGGSVIRERFYAGRLN
jgi:hypothetical protein